MEGARKVEGGVCRYVKEGGEVKIVEVNQGSLFCTGRKKRESKEEGAGISSSKRSCPRGRK